MGANLGNFKIASCMSYLDREDDFASSGCRGLADFVTAVFKCIESQARGFAHGHGKVHSVPGATEGLIRCLQNTMRRVVALIQKAAGSGRDPSRQRDGDARGSERSAGDPHSETDLAEENKESASEMHRAIENEVNWETKAYNTSVIDSARTRQYESCTLPAKQFGNILKDPPFSERQQSKSRYDGKFDEEGDTQRSCIDLVQPELPAHIARDRSGSLFERQLPRNPYKEVQLTGCQFCILLVTYFHTLSFSSRPWGIKRNAQPKKFRGTSSCLGYFIQQESSCIWSRI